VSTPDAAALLELIEAQQRPEVIDAVRAVADEQGVDRAVALLASVQVEIGSRWQSRQWTVADEHAATAIVDLAMTAATLTAQPSRAASAGTVVVACVEEEWHVLPARMFAALLETRGWDVVFLGASTPAEQLASYLLTIEPSAVALSCSLALHLPGAQRSIAACHTAGLPTIVGGAGFGRSPNRARALGADAWAAHPDEASGRLQAWTARRPPLATPQVDEGAQLALAAERSTIVKAAMDTLVTRFAPMTDYSPRQLARTREDLDYIIRYLESALLTADDSVMTDFTAWLNSLLDARGLPTGVTATSLQVALDCVPADHHNARRLLELAEATARQAPTAP
jgi:methanogenic corrinoid protein MtbC1